MLIDADSAGSGELVTSVNDDGYRWFDLKLDGLIDVAQSLSEDPTVQKKVLQHAELQQRADREGRKQPLVDRLMAEQPSITRPGGSSAPHPPAMASSLGGGSAVFVETTSSQSNDTSFASLGGLADLASENEELRAENAALRNENEALRSHVQASAEPVASHGDSVLCLVQSRPVQVRIEAGEHGQCRVRLHLATAEASKATPRFGKVSLAEVMESEAERPSYSTTDPASSEGDKLDVWHPALIMGVVVVVGGLALMLSRHPKLASLAAKRAAAAVFALVQTFRIPLHK